MSPGDEEGGSQQQQQEGAESHGAATSAEQGKAREQDKAWEQSTHCWPVLKLLLFISGFLAFVSGQPGRQPTSRPRAG